MGAAHGETFPCTENGHGAPSERQRNLALQLADMLPGAATVRVSLAAPTTTWPAAYARVRDEAGAVVPVSRTAAIVVARWVLRSWPETDWSLPHTLDLATATLTGCVQGRTEGGC